jgi:hypothetical protein
MFLNSLLKNKPEIFSNTLGENIIHLGAQTFRMPSWAAYTVHRVSKSHIARPDLISRIMYGTEIYGDFLCKVNGISNPFEINEDDILIIPNLNNMGDFMMQDTYNDLLVEDDNKPKPKAKKDKRKANEAVVGDTRFKIDKENHVIIY